jgi:hypothetical protein
MTADGAGKLTLNAENVHFDFGPAYIHTSTKLPSAASDRR